MSVSMVTTINASPPTQSSSINEGTDAIMAFLNEQLAQHALLHKDHLSQLRVKEEQIQKLEAQLRQHAIFGARQDQAACRTREEQQRLHEENSMLKKALEGIKQQQDASVEGLKRREILLLAHQHSLSNARAVQTKLNARIKHLDVEVTAIATERDAAKAELAECARHRALEQDDHLKDATMLRETIVELEANLRDAGNEARRSKEKLSTQVLSLEGTVVSLIAEKVISTEESHRYHDELAARMGQITDLTSKLCESDFHFTSMIKEQTEKLQSQVALLAERNEEIRRLKADKAQADTLTLATQKSLEGEGERVHQAHENHSQTVSQQTCRIPDLTSALEGKTARVIALETSLSSATSTISSLQSSISSLINDKLHLEKEIKDKLIALTARELSLHTSQNRRSCLETEVTTLKTQSSKLEAEKATLQQELGTALAEQTRVRSTLSSLTTEHQNLRTMLSTTETKLQHILYVEMPENLVSLQQNVADLTRERDNLLASQSSQPMLVEYTSLKTERDMFAMDRASLLGKIRERDAAIANVRHHIPLQISSWEQKSRTLTAERDHARTELAANETRYAKLVDDLELIGLNFSSMDNTFSVSKHTVIQITVLAERGQKVQDMCRALAEAQGDLTDDASIPLLDWNPFNLSHFLSVVYDWLDMIISASDGWEKLYKDKVRQYASVKDKLNRERDSGAKAKTRVTYLEAHVETLKQSLEAQNEEFTSFKATLESEGIIFDDMKEHAFVFSSKLVEGVREIAPLVINIQNTGKDLLNAHPDCGIESVLKLPGSALKLPFGLIKQMKKWLMVAQKISEVAWERCQSAERTAKELKHAKQRKQKSQDVAAPTAQPVRSTSVFPTSESTKQWSAAPTQSSAPGSLTNVMATSSPLEHIPPRSTTPIIEIGAQRSQADDSLSSSSPVALPTIPAMTLTNLHNSLLQAGKGRSNLMETRAAKKAHGESSSSSSTRRVSSSVASSHRPQASVPLNRRVSVSSSSNHRLASDSSKRPAANHPSGARDVKRAKLDLPSKKK